MPTSASRHPSRDAVLRDALNQLREQRNVTLDDFAFKLNAMVHALVPVKMADQPALASFTNLSLEATRAMSAWNKRVQRWANGDTEFPAWLEESWVSALEELGDTESRETLTHRHGFLAVPLPHHACQQSLSITPFVANAKLHGEFGEASALIAKMLADGKLDKADLPYAEKAIKEIRDAMSALSCFEGLIKVHVIGGHCNEPTS